MIRYLAYALVVVPATLLPVAGVQGVVRVAMLESHSPGVVRGASAFSPRNVENVALGPGRYRSLSVINGPSYFSAMQRYERQQLQDHQRPQGYGFGAGWSAKPR